MSSLNAGHIKQLLKSWGEDPNRDGLAKTPERFLNSMSFLTSGYAIDVNKLINEAMFDVAYQDMVVVRNIDLYSLCEHHLIPFYGRVHVGYIPNGKVIGLSKIPRIVDAFSRRLQVQERLTHQIATAIQEHVNPEGVGVVVEAYHLCMMMRGVQKQHSFTITSAMSGCFSKLETRNEFMSHVRSDAP
ncbi:MAG: GTP cyclohydrolase I FolE [Bdellovibrionota bacterium]